MSQTIIESLFNRAVESNSPVVPLKDRNQEGTCDLVVTVGPARLASDSATAFKSLAVTGLAGSSVKSVLSSGIGAPANTTLTFSSTLKVAGLLITVTGAPAAFRRAPQTLVFTYADAGSAVTTTVVCYPKMTRCQFVLVATQDNAGIGQVAAAVGPIVSWTTANNPGTAANELTIAAESINMRDFTSRDAK